MKKITSLLLALCLALCLFSGCSSSTKAETSEPEATVSQTPQTTASSAPTEESQPAQEDASAQEEGIQPLSDELLTLTLWKVWPPFLSNFDPSKAYQFEILEELLNVRMEVQTISTDGSQEKFNLMCAAGDMTDLIESGASQYSGGGTKAIADEILIDIAPYLEEYAPDYYAIMESDTLAHKVLYDMEGQASTMMGFWDDDMILTNGMWIRNDWLEEQGLGIPSTLDELENVLEVFKTVYGCASAYAMRDSASASIGEAFGAKNGWFVDNGEVKHGMYDEEYQDAYKEYLSTIIEWYQKGYFNSDFVTANDSTKPLASVIHNNESGIVEADKTLISDVFSTGEVDLQPVPPITKNADDKINNRFVASRLSDSSTVSISTNCKYPEIAVGYINAGFKEELKMAVNYGKEGWTFEYDENGDPQFTDVILNNPDIPGSFASLAFISPGIPYLRDLKLYNSTYIYPQQQICDDVFTSKDNGDISNILNINYFSFTTEESETIAKFTNDLDSLIEERTAKFIVGDLSIENDYDDMVAQMKEMGIEEIRAVYQAAYNRFEGIE